MSKWAVAKLALAAGLVVAAYSLGVVERKQPPPAPGDGARDPIYVGFRPVR